MQVSCQLLWSTLLPPGLYTRAGRSNIEWRIQYRIRISNSSQASQISRHRLHRRCKYALWGSRANQQKKKRKNQEKQIIRKTTGTDIHYFCWYNVFNLTDSGGRKQHTFLCCYPHTAQAQPMPEFDHPWNLSFRSDQTRSAWPLFSLEDSSQEDLLLVTRTPHFETHWPREGPELVGEPAWRLRPSWQRTRDLNIGSVDCGSMEWTFNQSWRFCGWNM